MVLTEESPRFCSPRLAPLSLSLSLSLCLSIPRNSLLLQSSAIPTLLAGHASLHFWHFALGFSKRMRAIA